MLERLTFFRFLAALSVIGFHYSAPLFGSAFASSTMARLLISGPIAVSFFYTLSGFVMAIVYHKLEMHEARPYWVARLARIYPVYCLALILSALIYGTSATEFLLNLTMVQAFIPGYALSLNAPGWSLSVEVFFYVLFPSLIWLLRKTGIWIFTCTSVLFWGTIQLWIAYLYEYRYSPYPSPQHDFIFYFPLHHLPSFLLGMSAGSLIRNKKITARPSTAALTLLASGFAYAVIVLYVPYFARSLDFTIRLEVGFLAPIFAIFCIGVFFLPAKTMVKPQFIFAGEASYAAYILQVPIIGFAVIKTGEIVGQAGATWLGVVCLFVISAVVFPLFETPMRRLLRRLGHARSLPAAHIA